MLALRADYAVVFRCEVLQFHVFCPSVERLSDVRPSARLVFNLVTSLTTLVVDLY